MMLSRPVLKRRRPVLSHHLFHAEEKTYCALDMGRLQNSVLGKNRHPNLIPHIDECIPISMEMQSTLLLTLKAVPCK